MIMMLRGMLLAACVLGVAAQTETCDKKSGTIEGGLCNGMKYNTMVCSDGGHPFNAATVRASLPGPLRGEPERIPLGFHDHGVGARCAPCVKEDSLCDSRAAVHIRERRSAPT